MAYPTYVTIQGTSAILVPSWVAVDASPPPQPPPDIAQIDGLLLGALFPPSSQQPAVPAVLTTPLDQIFNTAWSNAQPTVVSRILEAGKSELPPFARGADISVNLPLTGTLQAEAGSLYSLAPVRQLFPQSLPASVSADFLNLTYSVPNPTAGITLGPADFSLTFDFAITIVVVVPQESKYPLFLAGELAATNLSINPTNFAAGVIQAGVGLASFFTGEPLSNSFHPPDYIQAIDPASLFPDLSVIVDAFTSAPKYGFVELGVQVNDFPPASAFQGNTNTFGPTVEFDLTHPFDPPPAVSNAWGAAGTRFVLAQLLLTAQAVFAGNQVGVIGTGFPPGQATQLEIIWTDTCSGSVTQSEVQWGAAGGPMTPPTSPNQHDELIPRTKQEDGLNRYTAPGLAPNTTYAFRVRDYDCFDVVATQWSEWKFLQTQATQQVELILSYENTVLGTVELSLSGAFSTSVQVAADVPPGTYDVAAELGGNQLAHVPLVVVAPGQPLPATVEIYDTATGAAQTGTVTISGDPVLGLRGAGFQPGVVELWVDAVGGTSLGSGVVGPGPGGSFDASVTWPPVPVGPHEILAAQGPTMATASVWVAGVAQ